MDEQFKTEQKFSDILKEKDSVLSARLETIKHESLEEWVPLLNFDRGSHSGYPHLLNVERNADKMIPDPIKQEMTGAQIFLLLTSIFLHDIGKLTAGRIEEEEAEKGNKIRLHHKHSEEIITSCWAELGLPDERIARYIGKIARYHCIDNPFDNDKKSGNEDIRIYNMTALEPYGQLRIPFVAAILRIADEAEASWTRSLQEYLYKRIQKSGALMIKGVRRLIEEVEFCLIGECIILHVPELRLFDETRSEAQADRDQSDKIINLNRVEQRVFYLKKGEFESLKKMKKSISIVLDNWSPILEEQNIAFRQVFYEHKNSLLADLDLNNEGNLRHQKLADVLNKQKDDRRPGLQQLVDAIVNLSLGSLGHHTFSWQAIEAKIGQAISLREKWMVERMNYVSPHLYIIFPSEDKLKIHLDRNHITDLYKNLGCKYKGVKNE